jgi:hypothetical protein
LEKLPESGRRCPAGRRPEAFQRIAGLKHCATPNPSFIAALKRCATQNPSFIAMLKRFAPKIRDSVRNETRRTRASALYKHPEPTADKNVPLKQISRPGESAGLRMTPVDFKVVESLPTVRYDVERLYEEADFNHCVRV